MEVANPTFPIPAKSAPEFVQLQFRTQKLSATRMSQYHVYKPDGTYVTVEAKTASEAFKISGLDQALKIARAVHLHGNLLEPGIFENKEAQLASQEVSPALRELDISNAHEEGSPTGEQVLDEVASSASELESDQKKSKIEQILEETLLNEKAASADHPVPPQSDPVGVSVSSIASISDNAPQLSDEQVKKLLAG